MNKPFLFILFFITSISVYSQNFKGALFGGIVASQVSGDNYSGFRKPGPSFGLQTSYNLNAKNSLSLSLMYIQKGSRNMPNANKPNSLRYILRLNYIEIPFIYSFTISEKLWMDIGSGYAVLIKSMEDNDYMINQGLEFNKNEFDFIFGFHRPINKNFDIALRLHNTYLFSPIRNHTSNLKLWYNQGQYNTALVLSLQYNINGKD